MSKNIRLNCGGRNVTVGNFLANRLLPNDDCQKVGPFVFLEHVYPTAIKNLPAAKRGSNAHPHRGVITLTYVLSGSLQHIDSCKNEGVVGEGGIHWLNTGSGIIHEESPASDLQSSGGILHLIQFWINLPSVNKNEAPQYQAVATSEIPETNLPDNAGKLRVLLGKSGELNSPVKTFLNEFVYHVRLNPKSSFWYTMKQGFEYAIFVPNEDIDVNDERTGRSHLVVPAGDQSLIHLHNPGITEANAFIFGGNEYGEAIAAEGPFVMNNNREITEAYRDFFEGRYGSISDSDPDEKKRVQCNGI